MEGDIEPYVFVTVGTTRFDALVDAVDCDAFAVAVRKRGLRRVVAQVGTSLRWPADEDPPPSTRCGVRFEMYRLKASVAADMSAASLVVCHGGSGSVFEALRLGCSVVVVPNEALLGNHQLELAGEVARQRWCLTCTPSELASVVESAEVRRPAAATVALPPPAIPALRAVLDEAAGFVVP